MVSGDICLLLDFGEEPDDGSTWLEVILIMSTLISLIIHHLPGLALDGPSMPLRKRNKQTQSVIRALHD